MPLGPQVPDFPIQPFRGNFGGAQIADNEIDQLMKMALTRQQELEKLFNMARMQDLDLLGAAKAIQGFGKVQGLGQQRPLFDPFGGPAPAEPAGDVGEIVLTGNGITDRDLERLRNQPTLRGLSLAGTAVTDAGLEHLRGLKGLRRLNLSGTRVTDKGLEALHGLTELRELDLSNTRISDAASRRLQQVLPNVEITR
jgi:Leucine-rich repeat (LRR) protein